MTQNHHLRLFVLCCCIPLLLAGDERNFSHGDECPRSFHCAKLGLIRFPFTNTSNQNCGLRIRGCDGQKQEAILETGNATGYKVESITTGNKISVHDDVLRGFLDSKDCSVFNYSLRLPKESPMMSFEIVMDKNMALYKCNHTNNVRPSGNFSVYGKCDGYDIYYNVSLDRMKDKSDGVFRSCSRIQLPVQSPNPKLNRGSPDPFSFLAPEFYIQVNLSKECHHCYYEKEGQCRLERQRFHCAKDSASAEECHHCYCEKGGQCPQEQQHLCCAKDAASAKGRWIWKLLLLGLAVALFLLFTILLVYKSRCTLSRQKVQTGNTNADPSSIPNPTTCNAYFEVPVFTYKELEEATNNFHHTRELGDGAFGTVYYGKLKDGREVAIKRLSENNYRRVEQFMTEIQILTRLRHKNLVTLYGYSSLHTLRIHELLLVYEYIPNGTISCYLYGDMAKAYLLPWSTRLKIAVETASALAYLHASHIIHRDVKSSNILLDDNFCVKVADFGLSRLLPKDATLVSTAPQGTPGYVDPEYQQNCQLTSKSDVYSFGVVLVELISSMRAIDVKRDEDDIYLANLALKKIQKNAFSELVDPCLNFASDIEVKRMVVSVAELAFRCLQWDKELRPSMDEVFENLKRIENGKDETEQLDEANVHGAAISRVNLIPKSPTPLNWNEIGFLKNMKLPLSPNDIADKWESESTTTCVSVNSLV